jgi:hypothetical protein
MAYTTQYDDVDTKLIDRIDEQVTSGLVIFYASRRHVLEIVPEILTSVWLLLTLFAIVLNFNPLDGCNSQQCLVIVSAFISFFSILFFVFPLGIELFRWNSDVYYLSQNGWARWYINFRTMAYDNENMGFVVTTRVTKPWAYQIIGLDVGTLLATGVEEVKRITPLMPYPYTLQRRVKEAANYKPAKPEVGSLPWRK